MSSRPRPLAALALLLAAAAAGCPPARDAGPVVVPVASPAPVASDADGGGPGLAPMSDALPGDGPPRRGGTLVFGRGSDAVSLDPHNVTDGESVKAVEALFDTLVRYRRGSTEVEPALATSWTVSDDRRTWTFTLREGVKFHDGTTLDADAVVFSFERQRDERHEFHQGEFVYWRDQFSYVTRVEARDPRTVVFHLDRPFVPFLSSLGMFSASIVSPAHLRALRASGGSIDASPCGTGPFRLREWRRGEALVLEAFADHWDGRPHLDQLVLKPIPDNNSRRMLLLRGDLQGMDGANPADVGPLQQDASLRVLGQPGMNVAYLAFNTRKAPFDDVRVRRACALALDLERVAARLFYGMATPARNPLPPTLWGHDGEVPLRTRDLEQARRLLADAGHGSGFETTLWTMTNPRPYLLQPDRMATYVADALGRIGVRVTIVPKEWSSYLEEVQRAEHDMCFMGWIGDNGDPDNFLYVLLDRENAVVNAASNYSFYTSEDVHNWLVAARVEPDQARRADLYRRVQRRVFEDVPLVPLVHCTQVVVFRTNVRGFRLHPTGLLDFSETWLAE